MKKFTQILLICYALLSQSSAAQNWNWCAATNYTTANKNSCTDAAGNIFLYKTKTNWFPPYYQMPYDSVIKIDTSGNVLANIVLPAGMTIRALATTADTGYYMAGLYSGTINYADSTYTSDSTDIWFAKYNSSGNIVWFKTIQTKMHDRVNDICVNNGGLVMTGFMGDTATFDGTVYPKQSERVELFVASFDPAGNLLSIKFGKAGTDNLIASSIGLECEVDAAGDIYVLVSASGNNKIDNYVIGIWGPYVNFPKNRKNVVKFNSALQLQYICQLEECTYNCELVYDLEVTPGGEAYVVSQYTNNSSSVAEYSTIRRISTTGNIIGSYRLRPDKASCISSIELDECDNILFTGCWRSKPSATKFVCTFTTGRLSSSFAEDWLRQDSSHTNEAMGVSVLQLPNKQLFVSGQFYDTLNLSSMLVHPGGFYQKGFFARITAVTTTLCSRTTDISENASEQPDLLLYPNPVSAHLRIAEDISFNEVRIYNAAGAQVFCKTGDCHDLDLEHLPDGIYFLVAATDRGSSAAKLIVQH